MIKLLAKRIGLMEWATYRPDFSCASPNFMHLQSTASIITKLDLMDFAGNNFGLCVQNILGASLLNLEFFFLNYFLNCLIPQ